MAKNETLPRGIRKRGDKYFVDVSKNGKRLTATCDTSEEAIAKRIELLNELINGKPETSTKRGRCWTLTQAFDKIFEVGYKGKDWANGKSASFYETNRNQLEEHFGKAFPLDSIDVDALDKFVAACLKKRNSDGTINRKLSVLSSTIKVAHARGGCASVPPMPKRKEQEGRIRVVTDDEETTILGLCESWGRGLEQDCYVVLIEQGLRVGELLRLQVRDYNPSTTKYGTITAWDTKGGGPRTIPLSERAAEVVRRRVEMAKRSPVVDIDAKIFPIPYDTLDETWQRIRAVMGLTDDEDFVQHALRHTCCTRLILGHGRSRPMNVVAVQKFMGHKSITTTMKYTHVNDEALFDAFHDGADEAPAKPKKRGRKRG